MKENNIENINETQDLLKLLSKCNSGMRKVILKKANKKLVLAICESVFNMLQGNLDINKSDLENLAKYKIIFRKLIKKSNLKTKKKILVQHGGFLQFLIPAVITGISSIVSSIISKEN